MTDKRDLKNLCEVSKRLYEDAVPHLYRSISLYALEDDIEDIYASRLYDASDRGLLGFTRDIKVWSHFHQNRSARCMHMRKEALGMYWDESEEEADDLADNFETILGGFEPGAVRTLK